MSIVSAKVIGVTIAVLSKQHGGKTVVNKIDQFSRLLSKTGNFLICPISLETVLALIQVGAKGETAKEIAIGLKLPVHTQRLLHTYLELHPLEKTDEHYKMKSCRKLFFNENFHTNSNFKDETIKYFHADIQNINFFPAPNAIASINSWLKTCTDNQLHNDLLDANILTSETRAIFGNVDNLQGVWISGFQKNRTKKRKFFIDSNHYIETDTIDIVSKFNYFENDQIRAKFIEITYENSNSSLIIVLPYDIKEFSKLELSVQDIIKQVKYRNAIVNLRMPKIELKTLIPLNNILFQLGIVKAFQNNADLGLISDKNEDQLKIEGVMQETYLKIEEIGNTDDTFNLAIPRNEPMEEYITFFINRPFIIFFKDKDNGISFMGRFLQPDGKILSGSYEKEMAKYKITL
ncbi:hypothetical protein FQR65_LT09812 [Abscondita terminalis]|nr:hypothetical protein FQR65_LT09812 [Abscondita terminalis]